MNHYKWLDKNFGEFLSKIGKNPDNYKGLIVADGDKAYGFESIWNDNNIPFCHGVAIYLISKLAPYCDECRNTKNGWVPVEQWVIDNYKKFKPLLNEV